jgi:CcmD family protein
MYHAALIALLVSLVAAAPAVSQDPNTPVTSEAGVYQGQAAISTDASAPAASAGAGAEALPLAQAGQPPRTLRAYWHIFIAFAVTWLLLFGYAISLGRRWARLEADIARLRREAGA